METSQHHELLSAGSLFLALALLYFFSKFGSLIERWKQPAVIGELLSGIVLSGFGFVGFEFINIMRNEPTLHFFSEAGAVILLFMIGLESNVRNMLKVGLNALIIATIGVVFPFVGGTVWFAPTFFPHASFAAHLFLGASSVATSVGITARTFKELGVLKLRSSQVVLGAAVLDDVIGLIVLSVVTAIATGGTASPMLIMLLTLQALGFLIGSIFLGSILATPISRMFSNIHTGHGMKVCLALSFAFLFAYGASLVGLAPIVGAFCAGLILDQVHFNDFEHEGEVDTLEGILKETNDPSTRISLEQLCSQMRHTHVERMIGNIALFFVPIFFTFTGLQVEIQSFLDPSVYLVAAILSAVAIIGKLASGLGAQGNWREKLIVGVAMVPRGEVGLIFAAVGKSIGAVDDHLFAVIIIMIMITTIFAPPMLSMLHKRFNVAV